MNTAIPHTIAVALTLKQLYIANIIFRLLLFAADQEAKSASHQQGWWPEWRGGEGPCWDRCATGGPDLIARWETCIWCNTELWPYEKKTCKGWVVSTTLHSLLDDLIINPKPPPSLLSCVFSILPFSFLQLCACPSDGGESGEVCWTWRYVHVSRIPTWQGWLVLPHLWQSELLLQICKCDMFLFSWNNLLPLPPFL